jgi:hypothetical protein
MHSTHSSSRRKSSRAARALQAQQELRSRAERELETALRCAEDGNLAAVRDHLREAMWTLTKIEFRFGPKASAWARKDIDRVLGAIVERGAS